MKGLIGFMLLWSLLFTACEESSTEVQGSQDGQDETAEGVLTKSGLRYVEIEAGDGLQPKTGHIVEVHYIGRVKNGNEFDNSYQRGEPYAFALGKGKVIAGWDEGIALMRKGGKARLIIPPHLGYGSRGVGPIPANATLVFEVELVEVR